MAKKIILTSPNGTSAFYTVNETSVGKGGNNSRRADIQLVQFFLKQFYAKNPELFKRLPGSYTGRFAIDGICGGQTQTGILLFQQKMRGEGNAIGIDGLVDAPKGWRASITKMNYTIQWLNKWFKENGEGTEHYETLENHPDIVAGAPELKAELSIASNAAALA